MLGSLIIFLEGHEDNDVPEESAKSGKRSGGASALRPAYPRVQGLRVLEFIRAPSGLCVQVFEI